MIKEFHESQNISPISDFTNTTTDTRTTLSVIIRLYNGSTSLGETVWNVTTTGIQIMYSVVVSSTPITRIYIKHNGSRLDIPILDINVDFPNGQFWFTANYISINPTVAGGIQLSNMMLNRGSSALPYEPYGDTWNTKSYAKSISGAQTYTKYPIVLRTTEQSIPTWNVKGNTVQNGTPTSSNPVEINGVGVRTENLWNEDYAGIKQDILTYQPLNVGDGDYTLSSTVTVEGQAAVLFLLAGNVSSGASTVNNGVWNGQSRTVTAVDGYVTIGYRKYTYTANPEHANTMLNTGSTAKPYEPYGYKIPISSGGVTTNIYLGSTQTVRQIKKVVFDGSEDWQGPDDAVSKYLGGVWDYKAESGVTCMSTHYRGANNVVSGDLIPNNSVCLYNSDYPKYLYLKGSEPITLADFKAYLAQQYAAGTPVTVWYVLQTTRTAIVNEPLMKIGTYADTLSNATAIPTTSGLNTIDVNTTLKPSEMSLTFDGYKLCKGQRYSRTENLFDNKIASGYYNDSGELVSDTTTSHSTTYIPVDGTTYTISGLWTSATNFAVYEWDTNKNWLRRSNRQVPASSTLSFTVGSDAAFLTLQIKTEHGNIMLNTGSTAKPYQPYLDWE